jgi:GT2 family glycosyltransferase
MGAELTGAGAVVPAGVKAVVLTHMRPRLAGDAVRHLVGVEGFPPDQVVVVVNGEGGVDPAAKSLGVRVHWLKDNAGPAGGFLQALHVAFADPATQWAYLCEDDVTLLHLPAPRVVGLVARVEELDEPTRRRVGAIVAFGRRFVARSGHAANYVPRLGSPGELAPVDVSTWGATLVSRASYEAGIVPDPDLFFGFEDFDYYCALRRAGWSVLVDVPTARHVAHLQTSARRDAALSGHRPVDDEEPWRAFYFARNFFALARRHGRRSWIAWHLLYSLRRLQLATSAAERRAIVTGLADGARGRLGRDPRYLRRQGERAGAGDPGAPDGAAVRADDAKVAGEAASADEPTPALAPEPREAHRILAMVLTHNAPDTLARCLRAIAAQDVPPDAVLVVDNASVPAVALDASATGGIPVRVLRNDANLGPAGGWATAFEAFVEDDFDLAWVLDDDMIADPDCLGTLWRAAAPDPKAAFLFPRAIQGDGSVGEWGSWCGFLVARHIVEQVGVPRAELFWWAEDNEYCHWRIPQAGYERRLVDGAVVQHDAVRRPGGVPTWKYYYEARNMLWLHLHVMHRVGWYPRNVTKLLARAVLREHGRRRLAALWAMVRGLADGARARLGLRYPIEAMREGGGGTVRGR